MSNVTGNLAHSPANSDALTEKRNKLFGDARDFGRKAAQGQDALPMLAVAVGYAAADGIISAEKDADGKDDYHRLYLDEYVPSQSKKQIHEHTKGGQKANVSKLRQIGIAASKPSCDFPVTMTKVLDALKEAREADPKAKVKSAFPAYVDAARLQNEQDDDLSDEQIKAVIQKAVADDPTLEDIYERMAKQLEAIITGENKHGLKDQDEKITQAHSLIQERLAAMKLKTEHDEVMAKAIELGLIKVETPEQVAEAA